MPAKKTPQGIVQLRLHTHRLADLRKFYHNVFDLPIKEEGKTSLTIQAGSTLLTFEQTEDKDSRPFYHFAFNIPENMLPKAKVWLTKRTPLITRGTEDEYHFREWNAHAVYFWDPAENIVEFIARHNLANAKEGEFKSEDVLSASEIGLVV